MQKCYNVSIIGKVQDISFRALIEDIARFFQLKSLPEIKSLLVSFVSEQKEFNTEMQEHNKEMHEHNKRLERILEKMAER